ncbi:phage tail protein [Pseudomonas synxantha]|uniref:Phage tail protein n=1 Tax=Pseudomonas synxantha TaxID=47883 RepID=A0ABS0UG03_9PSED|nr:phage tail protein [Pseudomonas synxantha]MBI6564509.1 phage tail protein [Pseudomonas synxantha]MBI6583294.1 phage tail protein [Pseudomonas synxantha]MBI6646817.1 phage tail protein [Pseudomonas synxantha]WDG43694.1 phage tail protein [Pseudomonas synxantha]
MGLETTITKVVDACNKLTETVTNQIGKIDARVEAASSQFAAWRNSVQAKDINGRALYKQDIDLTGLSTEVFYPVWWTMPGNEAGETEITVSRVFYRDQEKAPFGQGIYHIAGLNLQLEGVGYIWNGDANFLAIKRISQTYRETVRGVSFGMICTARAITGLKPMYLGLVAGQQTNAPQFSGMYLRGGLSYTITKTFDYPVNYSKLDTEVIMKDDVNADWEVRWAVKPYSLTQADAVLGKAFEEKRLAYSHDNDTRYTAKV